MPTTPVQTNTMPWEDPAFDDIDLSDNDKALINAINSTTLGQRGDAPSSPYPGTTTTSADGAPTTSVEGGTADAPGNQSTSTASTDATTNVDANTSTITDDGAGAPGDTPSEFKVNVDGQDLTINTEQAEYLLRLNSWLQSQKPEVLTQWGGIESGTHTAISNEDYAKFVAWQANPSATTPKPAPNKPDLSYLDDDGRAYVEALESRTATSTPQTPQTVPAQVPGGMFTAAQLAQQSAEQARNLVDLERVEAEFTTKYNLTPEQVTQLKLSTQQRGAIASVMNQRTQYTPTGQIAYKPQFADALTEAFDSVMATDPTLKPVYSDYEFNQRLAREQEQNRRVNQKKGLAGSLASSPSAAVSSGGDAIDPAKMTQPQLVSAVAQALREAEKNGTDQS